MLSSPSLPDMGSYHNKVIGQVHPPQEDNLMCNSREKRHALIILDSQPQATILRMQNKGS